MPSSNRGHYIAVGGCLAFLLLAIPALAVPPESQRTTEGKPAESSTPAGPAHDSQAQPQQPPPNAASIGQSSQPDNAESETGDSEYYQREDLKAQQAMAEATDRIVTWTKVQIALGVVGTIFLLWTLFETRRATNIASDTAQRELRAYIGVKAGWIDFTNLRDPTATIVISNFGQTPAHDVRWWIHSWIEAFPLKVELSDAPSDFVMGRSVMGPGNYSTQPITLGVPMSNRSLKELSEKRAAIYIYGRVTYRDIFNVPQETRYRLFFRGDNFSAESPLSPYTEGNEAT
jgi:hypothetical protein